MDLTSVLVALAGTSPIAAAVVLCVRYLVNGMDNGWTFFGTRNTNKAHLAELETAELASVDTAAITANAEVARSHIEANRQIRLRELECEHDLTRHKMDLIAGNEMVKLVLDSPAKDKAAILAALPSILESGTSGSEPTPLLKSVPVQPPQARSEEGEDKDLADTG